MQFIPFPPHLAAAQAERTREEYAAKVAARKGRGPYHVPVGTRTTTPNLLGYRMPDGTIRAAYSRYKPEYPAGAEPGTVTVHGVAKCYPNGTTGTEYHCADFAPLESA